MNYDKSKYPVQDTDARVFLSLFDGEPKSMILAVGSNEEDTASILTDYGFDVVGYDLREPILTHMQPPRYIHLQKDFVTGNDFPDESFDHVYSLSAIEHFGFPCYPGSPVDQGYDFKATDRMWGLLRYGGTCWITVPYGKGGFAVYPHWRVYNAEALRSRIVHRFSIEMMRFFKSHPDCPGLAEYPKDGEGIEWVPQEDADSWETPPDKPHLTCFLKLRKR